MFTPVLKRRRSAFLLPPMAPIQMMACLGIRIQSKTPFYYAVFSPSNQQKLFLRRSLKMSMAQGKSKRPICPSCSKPARTCLCSRILTPAIENSVSVTILQHALESKHPLNSTRIARLGLKNLNVATVSDVNFGARLIIRLMETNGSDSLIFHQASEIGEIRKPMSENNDATDSRREGEPEKFSLFGTDGECSLKNDIGGSAITAAIGKNGVIGSLSHIWMPLTQPQKLSFSDILACPEACEALSRGFSVKKLKSRQLKESTNLNDDDECEFELEIPPGSVLLFPSDKAVDINDLNAIGFRVKNLIVLDGTWAKARRVYCENPWLNILPHLKLEVNEMSLYSEVRHQPKVGYLSSIESIVHALKAIGEKHEGLDNLLDAFESMVGDQRRCKQERLTKSPT